MKSIMTIGEYGQTEYKNKHGELHREDGPAAIFKDGTEYWFLHGKKIPYEFTSLQDLYDKHPEYLI